MTMNKKQTICTSISTLGVGKVQNKLCNSRWVDDSDLIHLALNSDELEGLDEDFLMLTTEKAGPREKLYFDPSKTRCAIVTCGGLCPGINDVIRAIVMEAYHNYNVNSVLGIRYGLRGFIPKYNHNVMELTPDNVSSIHQFGGTILGSSRGPQSAEEIVDALERMNINILFIIGGDGSMKAASGIVSEISKRKMKISIIGIPKTIDNDINFVTQSFGFDTAVAKATEAIESAHVEALGVENGIGLVKLMGRQSGFIAAHATLALKEVNHVLVPEQPFCLEGEGGLLQSLEARLEARNHAVIVCAEGAGQNLCGEPGETDKSGNPVLGDICGYLKKRITEHFASRGKEVIFKFVDPSYLIRSVPANSTDRVYCGFLGQHAVHAAMSGKTDMVVSELQSRMVHLPLGLVTSKRRQLNIKSDYWRSVLDSTGQMQICE